jgi:hypothetical protein
MDKAQFVELLQALTSPENTKRQQAETLYQKAKDSDAHALLSGMMMVLASTDVDETVRNHDAVLLRRLCTRGPEKDYVFPRLSPQSQQEFAAELLRLFEHEPSKRLQKSVSQIIVSLAETVCDPEDPSGHLVPNGGGWPTLLPTVFRMANANTASSAESCETSIRTLQKLVENMKDSIVAANAELGVVLQTGLIHESSGIRGACFLLICEVVCYVEKAACSPLLATADLMMAILRKMAEERDEDALQEAIQAMTEVATSEPDFFKAQLEQKMEPAKFLSELAKTRVGIVETGLRNLALEWLVTYTEKRTKWLSKKLPAFPALVCEVCMEMMCEVEDGEEDLKEWAARMDDEEGEEDQDDLFHAGEECIDRIVEAVELDHIEQALFTLIDTYAKRTDWQAKFAALCAIRQTIEYMEEKHIEPMATVLLAHMDHPHPRVRYAALHALGQLANDQSPHFQEASYKVVLPVLLQKMDDPVDRVSAMSMSAFTSFGEELDNALLMPYTRGWMEKLVNKLQTTQHRGVKEESITCIAVIAGVMEKDFADFYDGIMPMLKQLVMSATGDKEHRLRGKAFECVSLLGVAVGKERFLPDAQQVISEMMKTQTEADDVQKEYIKEACERICQCLKKDFAQFVPMFLPRIFASLKLEEENGNVAAAGVNNGCDDDDDEDEYVQVTKGDGTMVNVHSARFEELQQSVQLLHCFA